MTDEWSYHHSLIVVPLGLVYLFVFLFIYLTYLTKNQLHNYPRYITTTYTLILLPEIMQTYQNQ